MIRSGSIPKNSNIELLRAISMFLIVAYHYAIMGFYSEDIMYTANKSFVDLFGIGGKFATEVFVLISGYYMVNSRFTLKKLLSLMGQLWFYTLTALAALVIIKGSGALDMTLLKFSLFPLLSCHYWFASYYVLLMLLSPFLNFILHRLSKMQHALLSLLLIAIFILLPCFKPFSANLLWLFVTLYVTAAWLRLHLEASDKLANRSLAAALILILFCAVRIILSNRAALAANDSHALLNSAGLRNLYEYSPYTFVIAVLLFAGFCLRAPRQDKAAFILGGTSFGVYLFHANIIVNEYLYQDILHTAGYAEHPLLFLHAILAAAGIYASGTLLELLRQKSIGRVWDLAVTKLCARLPGKIKTR